VVLDVARSFGVPRADNIRVKRLRPTDAEFNRRRWRPGCTPHCNACPWYSDLVREAASSSVGERQRIHIARVLVCPTAILVLDEATRTWTMSPKQNSVDSRRASRQTTISSCSPLFQVRDADHVIVLAEQWKRRHPGSLLETKLVRRMGTSARMTTRLEEEKRRGP